MLVTGLRAIGLAVSVRIVVGHAATALALGDLARILRARIHAIGRAVTVRVVIG